MSDLSKQIEVLHQQAADIAEATSDIYNGKADFAIKTIGVLLEKLTDTFEDLLEGAARSEYYDKNLGNIIKETLSDIATKFSQIKSPTVNINPNISVDLKPIQAIAEEVSIQNKNIISLLEKENNEKSDAVERELLSMVDKNNSLIEKITQQVDYTKILKQIADNVKRDDQIVLKTIKVQRDPVGRIETLTPVYNK